MPRDVSLSRIHRSGNSFVFVIPRPIAAALSWKFGDSVAIRITENEKLVVERVALEKLAVLLKPEASNEQPR